MEDGSVRVIDRTFDILELIAEAQRPMSLTDIGRESEYSKTTVYRLLQTLYQRNYVQKTKEGEYTLGVKLLEIVSYHINGLELQTEAKPYLAMLRSELDLTVHLGVVEEMEVIYLEKMNLCQAQRTYSKVGCKTPAYCSSMGKCLLSCMSKEQ